MGKLSWDGVGERIYETGVDHGVLYVMDEDGYGRGVPWNGLISVTETPSGAESNKQYADNVVYLNLVSAEEFGGTIEAFTSPPEFSACDGLAAPSDGLTVGQQTRSTFGLSYRTKVGNDLAGQDAGYKLHLVYGLLASPSEKAYQTVNDSPEAMTLSWEVTSTPIPVNAALKPTSIITVDSTKVDAADLAALEKLLYGAPAGQGGTPAETFAKLPLPAQVLAIFA